MHIKEEYHIIHCFDFFFNLRNNDKHLKENRIELQKYIFQTQYEFRKYEKYCLQIKFFLKKIVFLSKKLEYCYILNSTKLTPRNDIQFLVRNIVNLARAVVWMQLQLSNCNSRGVRFTLSCPRRFAQA